MQAINTGTATRKVWLNNGAGWTNTSAWSIPTDFRNLTYQDTGVRFLDVDGDGLPDLIQNLQSSTTSANNTWLSCGARGSKPAVRCTVRVQSIRAHSVFSGLPQPFSNPIRRRAPLARARR